MAGDGWTQCSLGNLVTIRHGWPFKSEYFSETLTGRPIVVGVGNFRYTGGFRFSETTLKEYLDKYPKEYEMSHGDILLVMTCQTAGGEILGVPGKVPNDGRLYLHNQRLGKVEIKAPDLVDRNYLYWLFLWSEFNRELVASATGTKILHTAPSRIEAFSFRLPPIREQTAIARILGTLDDKIELNRQMNETLEATARALFKSWFVDFDPVRARTEASGDKLADSISNLFPDAFEESTAGAIPKGWAVVPVYDIAEFINGAAYRDFQPNQCREGLPIIKIAELKAGVTDQTAFSTIEMRERYRIDSGDILFSWSGNPDTSIDTFVWARGPAWLNQHIFKVVPPNRDSRAFVLMMLRFLRPVFAEIARNKQTTGLGHVTVADLKRLMVARPPNSVLLAWNRLVAPLIERSFGIQLENSTLTALRDTLLPKLISGELRVKVAEKIIEAVA
jgi:type I restriction enzyme S subunit